MPKPTAGATPVAAKAGTSEKTRGENMTDSTSDIVLSIKGMSKTFGRNRVLDHISLDVRRGSVMGLMGENGAGKSTMMKCLFGTYQKDEGSIMLDGKEISFSGPKDALENGIAMVHQELNQCLERNVVDNLFLGRYPVNAMGIVDEGRMRKEANEHHVGLAASDVRDRQGHLLQRQGHRSRRAHLLAHGAGGRQALPDDAHAARAGDRPDLHLAQDG